MKALAVFVAPRRWAPRYRIGLGQAADVGLVNQLSGEVTYQGDGRGFPGAGLHEGAPGRPLQRPGRRPGARGVFPGGRQKPGRGRRRSARAARRSEPASGAPAEVATLPSAVPQQIAQIPELIQIAKLGRSGGVQVRGAASAPRVIAAQQAEVVQAKDTYTKLSLPARCRDRVQRCVAADCRTGVRVLRLHDFGLLGGDHPRRRRRAADLHAARTPELCDLYQLRNLRNLLRHGRRQGRHFGRRAAGRFARLAARAERRRPFQVSWRPPWKYTTRTWAPAGTLKRSPWRTFM